MKAVVCVALPRPGCRPATSSGSRGNASTETPPNSSDFALADLGEVDAVGHGRQRTRVPRVDDHHVGPFQRGGFDFRSLDGADMDAWRKPFGTVDRLRAAGRAEDDVRIRYRRVRRFDGFDVEREAGADSAGKTLPTVLVRAEQLDPSDLAYGGRGFELGFSLKAGTDQSDGFSVFACQVFDAEAVGRSHAQPLYDAIRNNRERFAVVVLNSRIRPV